MPVNLFAVDISDSMFHDELAFVSYDFFVGSSSIFFDV